jgi:uncharacterized membrane protein
MSKYFKDRSEREILALAISNEEIDARMYADLAARLRDVYPATAQTFTAMAAEEDSHRSELIEEFRIATALAVLVVAIELLVISWVRNRYMDTPFLQAALQVIVGGVCVFAVGVLIGMA